MVMGVDDDEAKVRTDRDGEGVVEIRGKVSAQTRDQMRVEQLKGSIARIEEQIEKTRKELDAVCEVLKSGVNATDGATPSVARNATRDEDNSHTDTASGINDELILESARKTVNGHIKMLTKYNQLKDVAMGLFDLIAEHKGIRIGEVLREEGVEMND